MGHVILCLTAAAPALADNGIPRPDHIVIVIEENHSFTNVIGSPDAPYINALAATGALMTDSHGVARPSQPNYIALFCGDTLGITTNSTFPHGMFTMPNLGSKLLGAGLTFGGYSETLPSVGWDGDSAGNATIGYYKRKHNPWVNWQDAAIPLPPNKLPASVNMPFDGYFPTDFSTLPTLSIVAPNQLHDMHDGTIAQADAWLEANLGAYAAWCRDHNSLLIIHWDEDDFTPENHVPTILYGPLVVAGQYPQTIDHYDVLRTLEDMFGLTHDLNTVSAAPIAGIWAAEPCYANCDGSTTPPTLNVLDFACFLNLFAAGHPSANCDGSTAPPVLNVLDFACFLNRFAAGCP